MLLSHKGAILRLVLCLKVLERHHKVKDAWQFPTGLCSLNLRLPMLALELVFLLLKDANQDDVLRRVLKLGHPPNHLAPKKPICSAGIRLAGLVAEGFGLKLAPLKAHAACHRDAVNEQRRVLRVTGWVSKCLAHVFV